MSDRVTIEFQHVESALRATQRAYDAAADRAHVANERDRAALFVKRISYGSLGVAGVALAIGFGFWLANYKHTQKVQSVDPPIRLPYVPPASISTEKPNKVRTEISLFNSVEKAGLKIGNQYLRSLVAGHTYDNSNSEAWRVAWCYATFSKNGLEFHLSLANRTASGIAPVAPSAAELRELELTLADVITLRSQCPWRERG